MYKIRFIILMSLIFFIGCRDGNQWVSKKNNKDSLSVYLNWAVDGDLSLSYRMSANQRAYKLLINQQNDSTNRVRIFEVANNDFDYQDWPSFKATTNTIIERASEKNDTVSLAKAYRYKAEYYKAINLKDSAYFYYLKAEKIYTKLKDKENLGKIFLKKGIIQFYANDYLGADISLSQAYNLLRNSNDKEILYQAITMVGIISNEMKEYEKAIDKHTEALKLVRDYNLNDQFNQEATSLNNIGNVYQNLSMNEKAIQNFQEALADRELSKETPDLYAILIDNLAYSKFRLHDYQDLPDLFFEGLRIRDSLRNFTGITLSKIHLSEYYYETNDTIKAQRFAIEALHAAQRSRTPGDILAALKQVSVVDYKNPTKYSTEYIRINDSLQQAERKSQNKFARIQLETNEIIEEKDKLAEQNRNLLYFFIATLLIGILLFVIRNQRARNRELMLIQAQQKANEEIYNLMITQQSTIEESREKEKRRIAQELHDGILGRLFGARLNLDSLNKFADANSVESRFNYLNELKNIEQDIREISHDLSREKYALINNFLVIVNNLLEEQKNSHGTNIFWTIDEKLKWDTINNTVKINVFRILQESLQNINKYANASNITIEIMSSNRNLIIKIEDDGIGFDLATKKKGIGLLNIESRAIECNGLIKISSAKGKGTSITVNIPLLM